MVKKSSNLLIGFLVALFLFFAPSCSASKKSHSDSASSTNADNVSNDKSNSSQSSTNSGSSDSTSNTNSKDVSNDKSNSSQSSTNSGSSDSTSNTNSKDKSDAGKPDAATPVPNAGTILGLPSNFVISSPSQVPELDFTLSIQYEVNCEGGTEVQAKAAAQAVKVMLARYRSDHPKAYDIIKTELGDMRLCGGSGGYALRYEIPQSCADEFAEGFVWEYTNFVHEFAHIIHFSLYDSEDTLADQIQKIFNEEKGFVSDYASQDEMEFFAESVAAWFNLGEGDSWASYINHDNLKDSNPDMYALLKGLFVMPRNP
ncbi:MAG: hypothetical protein HQK54_03635 [Oligoflexales bacterium]|nr:hypothetical protein [Oligoflexales bacterium]